ncbi:SdpI family protein [Clostridium luticellarii]|uniref:SdpI family protein n=1 Tax=Clostridium luticellarii TaxID=1691940 RepID=UPI002356CD8E|nr:SdpI family protein [Clostridium luticellarii]MCI1945234.1 SdpI family protein [Clostridium luticellarii]MCI1969648.1 SdpI family protein [Clostridium luticellarii]MCI1994567.1 SdpI family protein [Clostridium luticellarii]MCI2038936.1 SdpI family protein [Clostridium luticellarii]
MIYLNLNYLSGVIMIIVGGACKLYPPKHINHSLGYRTPFAMKNVNTWNEANKFAGMILICVGIISLFITTFFIVLGEVNSSIPAKISVILLIISIPYTEIHLRKLFKKDGSRKENIDLK